MNKFLAAIMILTVSCLTAQLVAGCDCSYHPGGCTITTPAPVNHACHCTYKGFWTCGGSIVGCSDPSSRYCLRPDTTYGSCLLGGGDCGGY